MARLALLGPLTRAAALLLAVAALLVPASLALAASAPTTITTVAGGGLQTSSGIPATDAVVNAPPSVSGDDGNAFFLIDASTCSVRKVLQPTGADSGDITTKVGTGSCSANHSTPFFDETPSLVALGHPCCVDGFGGVIQIASSDNGQVVDYYNDDTFMDSLDGTGTADCGATLPDNVNSGSASFCTINSLSMNPVPLHWQEGLIGEIGRTHPEIYEARGGKIFHVAESNYNAAVAYLPDGNGFLMADYAGRIFKFSSTDPATYTKTQIGGPAGGGGGFGGDGGAAIDAHFYPHSISPTYDGGYLIADYWSCRIRKVSGTAPDSIVTTVAGSGSVGGIGANLCGQVPLGDGGPATSAGLYHPNDVVMIPRGILIADTGHNRIRLVDRTSILTGPDPLVRKADFVFASTDDPPHFKCTLDDGAPFDCPSPFTLTGAPDGDHTLKVWENGPPADPTPSSWSFKLDATAPTGLSLQDPAVAASGVLPSPSFQWSEAHDATTAIDHYELWIDGAKSQDVPTSACAAGACAAAPATPLAEADHTWQVKAVDTAGNVASTEVRKLSAGSAPKASLVVSPNPALVGRTITFDASGSSDTHGPIARYEWDLDGDGTYEVDSGATASVSRSYPAPTTLTAHLRVTDGVGKTAEAAVALKVTTTPDAKNLLGVSINNGAQYTKDPNVTLTVKPPANASAFLVSNDGGFFAPATFPAASTIKWKLDSSGPERLPKTVYLRFVLGPIISDNYTDDIILDEVPPVVQSASLAPQRPGKAASAAALRTFAVKVKAKDSNSGVGKVQVAVNKKKPGKLVAYKTSLKFKLAAKPKFIRAQDRAGNFSAWKQLR